MTTWPKTLSYYDKVFDVLHQYANVSLKEKAENDSTLSSISLRIMEKIHINMVAAIQLIEQCQTKPPLFLSMGLILRGMLSDLINYRYLRQVYKDLSREDFENEVKVLDLDFAKAYKKMIDSEKAIHKAEDERVKEIDKEFIQYFEDLHIGMVLRKDSEFRRADFKELLKVYLELNGLESNLNISTEAGKIRFVQDQHTDRIQLLYTYLSQFQHFSGRAYNFYRKENFILGNPHFTMMLLFFIVIVLVQIVTDLNNDVNTIQKLEILGKEIAEG